MFCNNCGQALPDGSRFCNYCGWAVGQASPRIVEPQPAAVVARDPSLPATYEHEQVVFTLRPTMIFAAIWYVLGTLIIVAVAAVLGLLDHYYGAPGGTAFAIIIFVVALLAYSVPLYKHIITRSQVYTLTSHKLEMRYGLISRTVRNIPLKSIQDVTVTASALKRLLGLGDMLIDSASVSGKIPIQNVRSPVMYADMILSELRRRP